MNASVYRQRQRALCEKIEGGVAVIFAAKESVRNRDVHYPFRQDSSFKYLTGLDEPAAILVLSAITNKFLSTLFVRPKDKKKEQWEGIRPGVTLAKKTSGVDAAHSLEKFSQIWPRLMVNHHNIYLDLHHSSNREMILQSMRPSLRERYKKALLPEGVENISPLIGQLRSIKGAEEIEQMKRAAQISCYAHQGAMAMAHPGIGERQVSAFWEYLVLSKGECSHLAYPSIVAGGENALILHYTENSASLKEGDLLLIDAGGEVNCYASDITRTFPINGKYSGAQKEMYQAVLTAQKKAIAVGGTGKTLGDIHSVATKCLVEWMKDKKILQGEVEEIIAQGGYKKYYPHSTGHWLGLDVHDFCPYQDNKNNEVTLAPGMTYTVEPGLYFPRGDSSVPLEFRGIGIRIEDDILVTKTGVENLTSAAPKELKEVETVCKRDYREFL